MKQSDRVDAWLSGVPGRRSFLRCVAAGLGVSALSDLLDSSASAQTVSDRYTGFIVVLLKPERFGTLMTSAADLRTLARQAGVTALSELLDRYPTAATSRLIKLRPAQILELEQQARERGVAPRQSLTWYWRIDARAITDRGPLLQFLSQLPDVALAYEQPRGSDPGVDTSNDVFASQQFHLKAAPNGIDAEWAWAQPNGSGALVGFVDVEQGWIFDHEDLPMMRALSDVSQEITASSLGHGTGVLGLAIGLDNTTGVVGIAPTPDWVSVSSHVRDGIADQVADAISHAAFHMSAGDVLLVEWQDGSFLPAELTPDIWTAISAATGKGIVVVEAGGNGNRSLDTFPQINRGNPATDSGAIIVGACHSALDASGQAHDRFVIIPSFGSNFGARVDCHAQGENLVTAGPPKVPSGALNPGAIPRKAYRKDFGATSGAAAVVAGAAVVLQGMHKAIKGAPLSPIDMRTALSTFGTPQGAKPGHIGVMPDLRKAAIGLSLVPSSPPAPPTNLRINC